MLVRASVGADHNDFAYPIDILCRVRTAGVIDKIPDHGEVTVRGDFAKNSVESMSGEGLREIGNDSSRTDVSVVGYVLVAVLL